MDFSFLKKLRQVERNRLIIYILLYLVLGTAMNAFGQYAEIAKFNHWWQVITCYVLYLVPFSILFRGLPFFRQYAYGLVVMGTLEFVGYALKTSYVYPNNILIQWFTVHNFTLVMALFFAVYFPLVNAFVDFLYPLLFKKKNGLRED